MNLIVVAVVIVILLSGLALYYQVKLRRLKKQQQERLQQQNVRLQEVKKEALNSIIVLAQAAIEKQVSLTEASIRITVLSERLGFSEHELSDFQVFTKLAEATAHIPILDRWTSLPKTEKRAFEQERLQHEQKYQDFIEAAARQLLANSERYRALLGSSA
ncbi:DUF2489 domain-containing protein [Teredinibacter waterburyi]|uniref:DUF2489 domain-containing protein n=1 Tax=Teredinibacter waterburyi TaxID=1500538 RepID=UPI001FE9CBC0|nr:DUF2489 domain-containing protein [Teredinibacter waterburyi]